MLAADETAIAQRKASVRNFGAFWIRPPGIPKTLQAMNEEEAERLEQAELERQERGLADMQAQQQLEEARQQAAETEAQEAAGELEEERDLDDDVPDADDANNTTADFTFNEDSMMEGSHVDSSDEENDERRYAEMEAQELTGAARDEEDLGIDLDEEQEEVLEEGGEEERNLEDSIPEAGSYQHTDTEVEDTDDSDSELQNSLMEQLARQQQRQPASSAAGTGTAAAANAAQHTPVERSLIDPRNAPALMARMRAQMEVSDALLASSSPRELRLSTSSGMQDQSSLLLQSSPMMLRGNAAGRGRRGGGGGAGAGAGPAGGRRRG
jgi:hypothetical protein